MATPSEPIPRADALARTPLYEAHVGLGAKMVPFAGWEMPVLYRGIVPEHQHTRTISSLFDVSHMGRIIVAGPGALTLLERLCTRKLADMPEGRVRYSHMCNESGGVLDDMVVARYPDAKWLVVCNASNRRKILDWIRRHAADIEAAVEDITQTTAMLAIQGPRTASIVGDLLPMDLAGMKRWSFLHGQYMGIDYHISRTGYTGEDGYEAIVPAGVGPFLWQRLTQTLDSPSEAQILPAGLGARDTLRLEAGLPLYGHELSEDLDPISAGFPWVVSLEKDFIGAGALRRIAEAGPVRKLVGLELAGRRIARAEMSVETAGGEKIGQVTSGTLGPTVGKSIAMAYVAREHAEPGTAVFVRIREPVRASVVALPFYRKR